MHHSTGRIAHITAFVTPVMEHWLEREIVSCRNVFDADIAINKKRVIFKVTTAAGTDQNWVQ